MRFNVGNKVKWGKLVGVVKHVYKEDKTLKIACEFIQNEKPVCVIFLKNGVMELDSPHLEHDVLENMSR